MRESFCSHVKSAPSGLEAARRDLAADAEEAAASAFIAILVGPRTQLHVLIIVSSALLGHGTRHRALTMRGNSPALIRLHFIGFRNLKNKVVSRRRTARANVGPGKKSGVSSRCHRNSTQRAIASLRGADAEKVLNNIGTFPFDGHF